MLSELVGAITDAGHEPGRNGVAIALDPAASEFYRDGTYQLAGGTFTSSEMVGYYSDLADRFPRVPAREAWPGMPRSVYGWLRRYEANGLDGLKDRSRRRTSHRGSPKPR